MKHYQAKIFNQMEAKLWKILKMKFEIFLKNYGWEVGQGRKWRKITFRQGLGVISNEALKAFLWELVKIVLGLFGDFVSQLRSLGAGDNSLLSEAADREILFIIKPWHKDANTWMQFVFEPIWRRLQAHIFVASYCEISHHNALVCPSNEIFVTRPMYTKYNVHINYSYPNPPSRKLPLI